jgi:cation diffusion facilitator family transporter
MMNLSLLTGVFMLVIKMYALWVTGSAAILSDAAESVVHLVAVGFASYSLRLARRRPDRTHNFGYDRISFFSAGFEGAMIILAAGYILLEAVLRFFEGPKLEQLGLGTGVEALVLVINGVLGLALLTVGKRTKSLILEANGRHTLVDSVTSVGVLVGLLLCLFGKNPWFDSSYFDPTFAILVALNILREGLSLSYRAFNGLMDTVTPEEEKKVEFFLNQTCRDLGIKMHELRVRNSGTRYWFQFHLIFPDKMLLGDAHKLATDVERQLEEAWPGSVTTTHLETRSDHDQLHKHASHPEDVDGHEGSVR